MIVRGKVLTPKFFVIACTLLACLLALVLAHFVSLDASIRAVKAELEAKQAEESALTEEYEQKSHKFNYMGTDDYIEAEARRTMGLIKDGELRYDIADVVPVN